MLWGLIAFAAFLFVGIFIGRGREQVIRENQERSDSMKADKAIAEVRRELAAKKSPPQG